MVLWSWRKWGKQSVASGRKPVFWIPASTAGSYLHSTGLTAANVVVWFPADQGNHKQCDTPFFCPLNTGKEIAEIFYFLSFI